MVHDPGRRPVLLQTSQAGDKSLRIDMGHSASSREPHLAPPWPGEEAPIRPSQLPREGSISPDLRQDLKNDDHRLAGTIHVRDRDGPGGVPVRTFSRTDDASDAIASQLSNEEAAADTGRSAPKTNGLGAVVAR
ncbi:hypothetical protein GCM10027161_22920 [Microbispora hainanensis]